jgi:hypothetical protein
MVELAAAMSEGWKFMANLGDGRAVIERIGT